MNETAMYSDAAVEFEVREMLEIIFLSILDLSIPAQSRTQTRPPATGLSQSVLTTVLAQPK